MEFEEQQAIYLQIAGWIEEQILTQKWQERIPAIRELAADLKVNPYTVARTYAHLETRGIIAIQRGVGYFVTQNARDQILEDRKKCFLTKTTPQFLKTMRLLNVSFDELKKMDDLRDTPV